MTKQYPLTNINSFMYIAVYSHRILPGDYVISEDGCVCKFIGGVGQDFLNLDGSPYKFKRATKFSKIIATNNHSLGLPLLPKLTENIEILAKDAIRAKTAKIPIPTQTWMDSISFYECLWIEGYTAAKAKKYTEEDILKILTLYTDEAPGSYIKRDFIKQLKSLDPLPIAVKVAMREAWKGLYVPKVDEKNTLIVKKWIYA